MAHRRPVDPILADGLETDIVIPVMGPTKAGKSTFLNSLLDSNVFEVGGKLASCTSIISAHIALRAPPQYELLNKLLRNSRIVFVDTPGFDDTHMGDEEILKRISDWLTASYKKKMLVGGVLYLHDISRDGFPGSSLRNLKLFTKLCGGDAMEQVALVTTKWDRLRDRSEGTERVKELESDFWDRLLKQKASVWHIRPRNETPISPKHVRPWKIIETVVHSATARDASRRILQIQHEIVRQKRFLPETDAGKELRMSLENLLKTAKDLKKQAREDAKGGIQSDALLRRQEEIDRLTAQLRAMKLPGLAARAMRFFGLL